MKKYIIFITVMFAFIGCKPIEKLIYVDVPRIVLKTDSVYINSTDSFIERQKGDTILQYRFKTYYKEKIKLSTDTITVVKEVKVPVEIEVDKIIIQKGFFYYSGMFGWLLFVSFVGYKIYNFFRPKL